MALAQMCVRLTSVKVFCRSVMWSLAKEEKVKQTRYDCWGQSAVCVEYLDKQFELSAINADYLDDGHT